MAEDPTVDASRTGRVPVIAPGYTFATVTDKISAIVLSRPTTIGWILGFGAGFILSWSCCWR